MEHILIVDDNRPFVLAISESLRFRGYQISSASDGIEALRVVDAISPDLVLLDIEMPGMDGLRFCQQLRRNPRFAQVPVIFMSVRSELKDKLAAYDAGADDYLVKPFDMRELGARLQAVLRRSARQAEAERVRAAKAEPEAPAPQTEAPAPSGAHVLSLGSLHLYVDAALIETSHSTARLTPAEMDLLKYLMAHPDQILASERLLQEVWLYPPGTGDPAVVRWHVKNLRRKIELNPESPVYLRTISHHGYMLVSDGRATR